MRLIVFSGLPGAGKSSLAEALGRAQGVPVYAKDWLEATLLGSGMAVTPESQALLGRTGYDLLSMLAKRQLSLGQSVILDSVAGTSTIRGAWRELADQYAATWRVIYVRCSDERVHRERLALRSRGIPGWRELTWDEVERVRSYFAPWTGSYLSVDSINSQADNLRAVMAYVNTHHD